MPSDNWREIGYFKNLYTTTQNGKGEVDKLLHYFCVTHREVAPTWIRVGGIRRAACPMCLAKAQEVIKPAKAAIVATGELVTCKCGAGPMTFRSLQVHNAMHERGGNLFNADVEIVMCKKCRKNAAVITCTECSDEFCEDCTVASNDGKGVCGGCVEQWRLY